MDVDDEEAWKKEPAYGTTISVISQSGCSAPINVADVMGYYDEEGLDVDLVVTQSNAVDAVGTGQAAIGSEHLTSSIVPMVNGVNIQFLGPMHTGCKALYVAADRDDITDAGDMSHMNIGIHDGLGVSDHNISLRFLKEYGADPNSVKFTNTDVAASVEAIKNGELDGAIYGEAYAAPFVEDGTLKMVNSITTDEAFKDEVCCGYLVNRDFARENPITTKKLARAMFRANKLGEGDVEGYVDMLYENDLLSGEKEHGFAYIDDMNYHVTSEDMNQTILEIVADYKELGILETDKNPEDILKEIYVPIGYEIPEL